MNWFDGTDLAIKQYDGEGLAEKIAEDMFCIDREQILEYPLFLQTAYFLIDFDTELAMEGIEGILENEISTFLPHIIKAFQTIGDTSDADILSEIFSLFIKGEAMQQINSLSYTLYLYTDREMWELLFAYLDTEIKAL